MSSTRVRLLEVTRRLVVQHGAGITMAYVARTAGVSRQTLYLHFASRASLLVAVVRHMDEQDDIRQRCEQALNAHDPVEALCGFVQTWLRYAATIVPMASAMLASRHDDPDAAAAWNDRMDELRAGFRHATQRLAQSGRLRAGLDAATAADLAWTMTSIPAWQQLTVDCGRTANDAEQLLTDAVTTALVVSQR